MNGTHKIYKFGALQYRIALSGILLNLMLLIICFLYNWELLAKTLLSIGLILSTYSIVDTRLSFYEINEHSIRKKTLTKETRINWKEVRRVVEDPRSIKDKRLVHVFCIDKSLYIPYWVNNQSELLMDVLQNVKENDDIYIQPALLEYIK